MRTFIALMLATFGPAASIAAHATNSPLDPSSACVVDLGGGPVISIYPWPRVPPELIASWRRQIGNTNSNEATARARRILTQDNPNAVVRDLFLPLTLAEVRRHYQPDASPVPALHPGRYDTEGTRELIARGLPDIEDRKLRDEWVRFLSRDSDARVKIRAARVFLRWPSRRERDDVLLRNIDQVIPDRFVLKAAISAPDKFSPPVLWRLIQRVARQDYPDAELLRAISMLPHSELPHAWYHDHLISRNLKKQLAQYDPGLRDIPRLQSADFTSPSTAHEAAAFDYAFDLTGLNADYLRSKHLNTLLRIHAAEDERAAFVTDILSWAEILEILRNYALARQSPHYHASERTLTLDKLRAASLENKERFELAKYQFTETERDWLDGHRPEPRLNYDETTLQTYAALLAKLADADLEPVD